LLLNQEQELLISVCRMTHNMTKDYTKVFFARKVNWGKLLQYACKNKVLGFLYDFILTNDLGSVVPNYFLSIMDDYCSCNFLRNEAKLSELEKVRRMMHEKGVLCVPVKGGYLIDNLYKNRRIRATNDIDLLLKKSDISAVDEIMKTVGYEQGEYDPITNSLVSVDRVKRMLYKTSMYNLLPYIKINNDTPSRTIIFDFSFALDFSLDTSPVVEMLDFALASEFGVELLPEYFFVHMCCHHYREASNVAWILIGKDLNLMKFCDVREFVLQKMDPCSIAKAINFAKKHGLEKAVYFTMYFVREIYNDGYETEMLESLGIDDESFLYQFGEKDYDELQTRKKDFWSSIFSDDNIDEITLAPKNKRFV